MILTVNTHNHRQRGKWHKARTWEVNAAMWVTACGRLVAKTLIASQTDKRLEPMCERCRKSTTPDRSSPTAKGQTEP